MNIKRLLPAILIGFVFIFVTDFLIHGLWLRGDYAASRTLWRGEKEMVDHLSWMMTGQFLAAATFVILWAIGCAESGGLRMACAYGLLMGLFGQVYTLIMYSVMPLPFELATKWFISGLAQGVLLGVLTSFTYRPVARPAVE